MPPLQGRGSVLERGRRRARGVSVVACQIKCCTSAGGELRWPDALALLTGECLGARGQYVSHGYSSGNGSAVNQWVVRVKIESAVPAATELMASPGPPWEALLTP